MKIEDREIYHQYMYSYPHKTAYRPIDPICLTDLKIQQDSHLYVHIPFCKTKCGYCNLFSVTGKNQADFNQYLDAMEDHAMQMRSLGLDFQSVTIGGGTPLVLEDMQLERLFHIISLVEADYKDLFSCIETSPNETTTEKLWILKENGVNRVSIGVQSFNNRELEILNRKHLYDSVVNAVEKIKKIKFDILNIDIIYGIPTQTVDSLRYSIENALSFDPEEVFLYPLYLRDDATTLLKSDYPKYALYLAGRDMLLERGYRQQSMRRFTKMPQEKGAVCGFENTLALGVGGRTYIGAMHFCAPYSNKASHVKETIAQYIRRENKLLMDFGYVLNDEEQKRRFLLKHLFVADGLDAEVYYGHFRGDIFSDFPILHSFLEDGYLAILENHIMPTPLGLSFSDYLGPLLISTEVAEKMKAWVKNEYR